MVRTKYPQNYWAVRVATEKDAIRRRRNFTGTLAVMLVAVVRLGPRLPLVDH